MIMGSILISGLLLLMYQPKKRKMETEDGTETGSSTHSVRTQSKSRYSNAPKRVTDPVELKIIDENVDIEQAIQGTDTVENIDEMNHDMRESKINLKKKMIMA